MILDILLGALIGIVIVAFVTLTQKMRGLIQKVDELEESRIEFFDVLLTRVEATEHVIDSHHSGELENERKKIQAAQESSK